MDLIMVVDDAFAALPPSRQPDAALVRRYSEAEPDPRVQGYLFGATGRRVDVLKQVRNLHPSARLLPFGPTAEPADRALLLDAGFAEYLVGDVATLVARVARESEAATALEMVARELVGIEDLRAAQERLRLAMFREAYARTAGNKGATARLLGVTRAAIQKIVRAQQQLD
jgi:hypothetical protein